MLESFHQRIIRSCKVCVHAYAPRDKPAAAPLYFESYMMSCLKSATVLFFWGRALYSRWLQEERPDGRMK
jgi:hypothetical protein